MRYRNQPAALRIIGAILLILAPLFFFLPFIATNFFGFTGLTESMINMAAGFMGGGVSATKIAPAIEGIVSFGVGGFSSGEGLGILLAILFWILFVASLVLPIMTGIMALVNKNYFPALISCIVYSVFCIYWIVIAIVVNSYLTGAPVGFWPTIWLFLGLVCVIIPVFFLRKERPVQEPVYPEPVTQPVDIDPGEITQPSSKSNMQGVQVQVRYTDDSGTHVVKRQILTDSPLTVGRSDRCKLVLTDSRASSVHAKLIYDDLNGLVIEDNGSTNGIQVNGETIMKHRRISKDDSVRIGDSKLQFTVIGSLDDFDGERTIAAGERYHEPVVVKLTFVDDGGPRTETIRLKEVAIIGRTRECEVCIDSNTVSHKHARLLNLGNGRIAIEDNASSNGVKVNGSKIDRATPVTKGDVITLGAIDIRVSV